MKKTKNSFKLLFLVIAFIGMNWTLFSNKTSVLAKEKQVITVGTSGQTKPMNYFDTQKQLTGFEIELLKKMENQLDDIEFKFEITEFASLFAGLDSNKFDLVANNLGEGKERREKYLFSKHPYIITHNVLITQTGQPKNLTIGDLKGKSIGVVPSSPQSQFLEAWNKENPKEAVTIKYVDSDPSQIIRNVHTGKFDATIYATTYLNDVKKTFGIDLQSHPIKEEAAIRPPGSYFIFRKDDLELRNRMDQVIEEFRQDGTLKQLSMDFLDEDNTQLTQDLIVQNEQAEKEMMKETAKVKDSNRTKTDGKLFAPEIIPTIIKDLLPKLPITLLITIVSALLGLTLGFLIALVKIKKVPVLSQILTLFVSFMRGTPQLIQLFLAFYGFPLVMEALNQRFNFNINVNNIPAILYVFIALGLNEAAYTSETFRAAILSVDKKEIEAARSIGMKNSQILRRIILPSALIVAVPSLANSIIALLKGTSLAFTVTVIEIMGQARIIGGANLRFFEAYIGVALIYWIFCILIEQLSSKLEKRLTKGLSTN